MALLAHAGAGEDLLKKVRRFSHKADSLAMKRNRFVHDPWLVEKGVVRRFEATAERKLVFEGIPTTRAELAAVVNEIWEASTEYTDLAKEFKTFGPPTSPEKRR